MFYSHQLLARKALLGQIWMDATIHAKINRRKLDKPNIIKICEEILNPSVPMAPRLSGILMGGVVDVYERKLEINEAWKRKAVSDPTILRKNQAKYEAVTLPDNNGNSTMDTGENMDFSSTSVGFNEAGHFSMTKKGLLSGTLNILMRTDTHILMAADGWGFLQEDDGTWRVKHNAELKVRLIGKEIICAYTGFNYMCQKVIQDLQLRASKGETLSLEDCGEATLAHASDDLNLTINRVEWGIPEHLELKTEEYQNYAILYGKFEWKGGAKVPRLYAVDHEERARDFMYEFGVSGIPDEREELYNRVMTILEEGYTSSMSVEDAADLLEKAVVEACGEGNLFGGNISVTSLDASNVVIQRREYLKKLREKWKNWRKNWRKERKNERRRKRLREEKESE